MKKAKTLAAARLPTLIGVPVNRRARTFLQRQISRFNGSIARTAHLTCGLCKLLLATTNPGENRMFRNLASALSVFSMLLLGATTLHAQVLIVEDFSGSGAALNGVTADTFDAGIISAGGANTWSAGDAFLDDGTVVDGNDNTSSSAYLNLGSYINDRRGSASGDFDLTMTISETTGNWISLGFVPSNAPRIDDDFVNESGIGTIIYRDANNELDMFAGPSTNGGIDGPNDLVGARTLTVSLDLTPAGGYDGETNFGTVTWSDSILGFQGSSTYTSELNFGTIFISEAKDSSGSISDLSLTQFTPAAVGWGVNGGGSFNVAGNWLDNVVPTSTAVFDWALTGANAPAAVTLDAPVSLNEVVFENIASYSLDGPSTLTLTGGADARCSRRDALHHGPDSWRRGIDEDRQWNRGALERRQQLHRQHDDHWGCAGDNRSGGHESCCRRNRYWRRGSARVCWRWLRQWRQRHGKRRHSGRRYADYRPLAYHGSDHAGLR